MTYVKYFRFHRPTQTISYAETVFISLDNMTQTMSGWNTSSNFLYGPIKVRPATFGEQDTIFYPTVRECKE